MEGHDAGSTRPRIGVTWIGAKGDADDRYLKAVRLAGGEPVPLAVGADSWAADLARVAGLLLTGGGDVDPVLFGQTNDRGLSRSICRRRDELELEALRFCLDRGVPVLGICRGFQVINVGLGGPLLQDICTETAGALRHESVRRGPERLSRYHTIEVSPGTRLAGLLGQAGPIEVNSRHHQGVLPGQLAAGLRAAALAPDGLVEGLEAEDGRFLIGIQCHPERADEVPEAMGGLFRALVAHARES